MKRNTNESKLIDKNSTDDKLQSDDKPDPKILTIQEVADLLRIHRSTVTRLAKSGEIKSSLIGSRRMFKDIDVWSFFENQVDRGYVFGEEL
jgi:excisionase family DNA binding protein